jgi:hypothetical protein
MTNDYLSQYVFIHTAGLTKILTVYRQLKAEEKMFLCWILDGEIASSNLRQSF